MKDIIKTINKLVEKNETSLLEQNLKEYSNVDHCVCTSSRYTAILSTLMSLNVEFGDLVFVSSFGSMEVVTPISLLGATPIFVDIDPNSFTMHPKALEESIKYAKKDFKDSNLKAVIINDMFGLPADYSKLIDVCKENGLRIISDNTQSFGALYGGKKIPAVNGIDFTCVSFSSILSGDPNCSLTGITDGGAVFTNNRYFENKIRTIINNGRGVDPFHFVLQGGSFQPNPINSAVINYNLKTLDEKISKRQRLINKLLNNLNKHSKDKLQYLTIPTGNQFYETHSTNIYSSVSFLVSSELVRTNIINPLIEKFNLNISIYYPNPLHLQPIYKSLQFSKGDFPITEKICNTIFQININDDVVNTDHIFKSLLSV